MKNNDDRKARGGSSTSRASHPRKPRAAGSGPRGRLFASRTAIVVLAILLCIVIVGAGVFIVTQTRAAGGSRARDNALKLARLYAEKGEYDQALKQFDSLDIDDPAVKAALEEVLAKKKAADEVERQMALAAQKAQADLLRAGLNDIGDSLKQPPKIVIQEAPRTVTPPEDSGAKEKERQKKIQDLLKRGAELFNSGRYAEARKSFDAVLALDPDNAQALAYSGLSWLRENPDNPDNVQKAVDLSRRAVEKDPDLWIAHRTLGEIYEAKKLDDEAMKEYAIAVRLNPDDADSLYALGKLQFRAKRFSDALVSFEGCIRLRPDFANAHFNRGVTLLRLGDKDRALDAFKGAAAVKRDYADAHYQVGVLSREKGNLAGATESLRKAVDLVPTNPLYLRELAILSMLRGDYAGAESLLAKALAADPENAATNSNMAQAKLKLDKPREALAFAQKALSKAPDSAQENYILGLVHEQLGSADEALRYYGMAIQKDPRHASSLINLGGLYDSRGMPDKALPYLQDAVEAAPQSYEAHNNLGSAYLHLDKFSESITQFRRALEIKPDTKITMYNLGLAYSQDGQVSEAKSSFMRVIQLDAAYWEAYLKLAQVLVSEDKRPEARDLLTRLLSKKPSPEVRTEAQKLLDGLK